MIPADFAKDCETGWNNHGVNAAETLRFDDHGIVVEASAAHFDAP